MEEADVLCQLQSRNQRFVQSATLIVGAAFDAVEGDFCKRSDVGS